MDDLVKETARQEAEIKGLFKAVDRIEKKADDALKIATSIERLALSVETLTKQMENLEKKVSASEQEPAKAWQNFKWLILGLITTGIGGALISALMHLITKK